MSDDRLTRILEKYTATPSRVRVVPYSQRSDKKKDDIPDHMKDKDDKGFSETIVHPGGWEEKRSKKDWKVLRPAPAAPRRKCFTCGKYD